jgi:hypothetical protein
MPETSRGAKSNAALELTRVSFQRCRFYRLLVQKRIDYDGSPFTIFVSECLV